MCRSARQPPVRRPASGQRRGISRVAFRAVTPVGLAKIDQVIRALFDSRSCVSFFLPPCHSQLNAECVWPLHSAGFQQIPLLTETAGHRGASLRRKRALLCFSLLSFHCVFHCFRGVVPSVTFSSSISGRFPYPFFVLLCFVFLRFHSEIPRASS